MKIPYLFIRLSSIALAAILVTISATKSVYAVEPLTREQKLAEIESLKAYEAKVKRIKSQKNQSALKVDSTTGEIHVLPNSQLLHSDFYLTEPKAQKAKTEFVCDKTLEANCDLQKLQHDYENKEEKPQFYVDGKYIVSIFFNNDKAYPDKYSDQEFFTYIDKQEAPKIKNEIYQYYLGANYDSYSPELLNVNNSVLGIDILIDSSEQLIEFINDDRVKGIYHVGNSADLPESQPTSQIYNN